MRCPVSTLSFVSILTLAFAASLFAQSSNSQTGDFRSSIDAVLGLNPVSEKEQKAIEQQQKFCEENTVKLNLLILDDYFVISQAKEHKHTASGLRAMYLAPDTLVTKIYSANAAPRIFSSDTILQDPVWTRVYGVKQASSDSVLSLLKEKFQQNKGKVDREEILISYPLQDKSIFTYKKFFSALKKIGYTKIRLVGFSKEFDDNVYKKLQLKKYSEKQIESWESSKNKCNKDWLRIVDNELIFGKKSTKWTHPWDGESMPEPGVKYRSNKGILDIIKKETQKLNAIHQKYAKKLANLKNIKTPEHPDAETQIKIIVKFTIEPEGNISKIEVISSNSHNQEFDKLICDKVSQWTFEKTDSSTTVTYPITFDKK